MKRRTLIAGAGVGIAGTVWYTGVLSSDGGGSGSVPVYGDGADNPDHQLRVRVTVVDDGSPLANEPVVFHDHGGSYNKLEGTTGEGGKLVFVDSVGPSPCNSVEIEVPDRDTLVDIGCHDGGKRIAETVDVANDD